jgi:hypothetical protein
MDRDDTFFMSILLSRFVWAFSLVIAGRAYSQSPDQSASFPAVYISGDFYDMDYVRTEIPFVNYVHDRKDADVHVLVTSQQTGGGGMEYTLHFFGIKRFHNNNDTLVCITSYDDTFDRTRQKIVKTIKSGLLKYLTVFPIYDNIDIVYHKEHDVAVKQDRWNNWVFRIRFTGRFSGQSTYQANSLATLISARRTAEVWKYLFYYSSSYREDRWDYEEDIIENISRSNTLHAGVSRSVTDHLSLGLFSDIEKSTFNNFRMRYQIEPGIEFNIFPYQAATRKQFRLQYRLQFGYRKYYEETIYDKSAEGLVGERISGCLELIQPWGDATVILSGSHYLRDLKKNKLTILSMLDIRLVKGFSLSLQASYDRVHDQLSIPKRGASLEEILLKRRELETQYNYSVSMGISYTFGSMYNNIVNPRWGNW